MFNIVDIHTWKGRISMYIRLMYIKFMYISWRLLKFPDNALLHISAWITVILLLNRWFRVWRTFITFSNMHCLHTFHRHALPVPGSTGHYHLKFRLIKDKQLYDLENKVIKTIKISGELYHLQAHLEAKSVQLPYNTDKYHKLYKCLAFYFLQWWVINERARTSLFTKWC